MADTSTNCLRFDGESLQPCEAPDWFQAILKDGNDKGGDVTAIYQRNGVHFQHRFGKDLESVEVYDARANGYVVEYWDHSQCLAVVLIPDVRAYLVFRAKYLFAWAWLIKEMERIDDADYERDLEEHRRSAKRSAQ